MADRQGPTADQCAAALIGCAVGDALGAWIEGWSRAAIAEQTDLLSHYRPFRQYPAGQYTDDTQLTIATAKSLVRKGAVDGEDIANEIAQLWRNETIIGAGPVAKRAVSRFLEGVDWREAAATDDLPFNGAAMRISPLGLWHARDNYDALREGVRIASIVTHGHPAGIDAAVVIAKAVALAARGGPVAPGPFLTELGSCAETEPLKSVLPKLEQWLQFDETMALQAIVDATQQKPVEGFGINVMAASTTLGALYCFLKSPHDYSATIERALRIGGDVDTIAAIAGAISGARLGMAAIPTHLRKTLVDGDEIEALGRELHRVISAR